MWLAIFRRLMPSLLRRTCPQPRIPRSGRDGELVNCLSIGVQVDADRFYKLHSIENDSVSATYYEEKGATGVACTVALSEIDLSKIEAVHFYGLDEIRYEGFRDLAVGRLTGWPYVRIHVQRIANRAAQRLFNRRTLETARRLQLLREVLEATSDGETVDAMDLMTRRYGYRWADHPGWQSHHKELQHHLQLLADAGELEKGGVNGFRASGITLRVLAEAEEQDRRHNDNLRIQWALAILAALSVIVAAIKD